MTKILRITSINYKRQTSCAEKVLSRLSNYFYLGGTQITVIKGKEVQLEKGKLSWPVIALKVSSYILLFPITFVSFAIYAGLRYSRHFVLLTSSKQQNSTLKKTDYLFRSMQNERGSQEGCRGGVSKEETKKILTRLQRNPSPGISFDATIVDHSSEIIGTCTAMSIKFAVNYFRLRNETFESTGSEQFQEKLRSLKGKFETSSKKMRSKQLAYSSIKVTSREIDTSKNKIESCVRSHGFEIDYCSNEMDINEKTSWEENLNKLDYGVYFIRMIQPRTDNDKLESFGHSMIYIHEKDAAYFYDNNVGLEKMPEMQKVKHLYNRLLSVYQNWNIPSTRFYRLFQAR